MRLLAASRRAAFTWWFAGLSALSLAGCSLLYDVSGVQCSQTSDCEAKGGPFVGTVCQQALCVTPDTGTGGTAGGPGDGDCTSHAECIDSGLFYGPAACIEGECIQLDTDKCPIVLGLGDEDYKNLRRPEPIILGAYGPLDPAAPQQSGFLLNYQLAIDEMNEATGGGLPGGAGGSRRPFVVVVCEAVNDPKLDVTMAHLIDDLHVPAIISALNAPELLEMFSTKGLDNDVFFMSPIDADTTLTTLEDDDLLWHMLPESRDLAPGYTALVHSSEEYVRLQDGLDAAQPIKVALVEADSQFMLDIGADLMVQMTFNGGLTPLQNEANDHFLRLRTDSAATVALPDVTEAVNDLLDFEPDIVVSLGAQESLELIQRVEIGWAPDKGPKPFWLVSPWVYGQTGLLGLGIDERMIGVNFAGAVDQTLYELLQSELIAEFGSDIPGLDGKENFYDAAYYLMYAIAAAGDAADLSGREITAGLERVIDLRSSVQVEVGRPDIANTVPFLTTSPNSTIGLTGTLGPPEFNLNSGARIGLPSYYCVYEGERIQNAFLYDPVDEAVTGMHPCVPGFPP